MSNRVTCKKTIGCISTRKKFENEDQEYFTPQKLQKPQRHHNRIISLNISKFKNPSKRMNNDIKPSTYVHQKTQSLNIGAQQLEKKIKMLEDSITKLRIPSATTRIQSIDILALDKSIGVSCSSDDSLNILREQVDYAKNLNIVSPPSKIDELNFNEELLTGASFCSIQSEKFQHKKKFSLTEHLCMSSILALKLF